MDKMNKSCSCGRDNEHHNINCNLLSLAKRPCCKHKLVELSNSNTLLVDKSENFSPLIYFITFSLDNTSNVDNYFLNSNQFTFPDKIPKDGIPVSISLLLI